MNAFTKTRSLALAAIVSCLLVAYAVAQTGQPGAPVVGQPGTIGQPGQPGQPPIQPPTSTTQPPTTQRFSAGQPRAARSVSPEVEQYLVSCLLAKNEAEVEISQFAQQRAQNAEVKQFAQQLIADHQAAIQRLQRIANAQVGTNRSQGIQQTGYESQPNTPQQPGIAGQQPGYGNPGQVTSDRSRPSSSGPLQELAAIEGQIVKHANQAFREKLQSKQGAEFDHCFVGSQVASHMHMLAALEVIQGETSGPLNQIAQESQQKVKHHLEMAEKLADQLKSTAIRQSNAQSATPTIPR